MKIRDFHVESLHIMKKGMVIKMSIHYYEETRIFKLDTPKSTYMIGIVDEENFIGHIYYGKRVIDTDLSYTMRLHGSSDVPSKNSRDRVTFLDSLPMEYSTHGIGDFRESSISVKDKNGHTACSLSYVSHDIYKGKEKLPGLPATFANEEDCTTLELICEDKTLQLQVILIYNVFENLDVITRSVKVHNESKDLLPDKSVICLS